MFPLLSFRLIFLAVSCFMFGLALDDGQYRISIANQGAPWYLALLGPGANATFELESNPGPDVWAVNTTDSGLRMLTSVEYQVRLGYLNANPGTPLQGIESDATSPDTFNIEEGPAGRYYVYPSSLRGVAVSHEHPPTVDLGGTAVFRSTTVNPPVALTFTPVEPANWF